MITKSKMKTVTRMFILTKKDINNNNSNTSHEYTVDDNYDE